MNEIFLKTDDNVIIAVNHYNSAAKSVVILCPGWFMTKDSKAFAQMTEEFSKHYDVISMDFRGHGRSSGFYTFTAKEINDLRTVVHFAKKYYDKVYLIGFSLGGALALIHEAIEKNTDGIIAVSAPHSFEKIENRVWRKEAWLPTIKKFEFKRWISVRPSVLIRKKIRPADAVKKVKVPSLFIAGKKDVTVHAWHTKELFRIAKCMKKFELFEHGLHAEDLFLNEKEKFMKICLAWLDEIDKAENNTLEKNQQ